MRRIHIGSNNYYREDDDGFWVAEFNTDPMSATLTPSELGLLLKHQIKVGTSLLGKVERSLEELKSDVKYLKED